jgi:hypothetical protein
MVEPTIWWLVSLTQIVSLHARDFRVTVEDIPVIRKAVERALANIMNDLDMHYPLIFSMEYAEVG